MHVLCTKFYTPVYVFVVFQYLDLLHPSEKALYPEYFARREVRKKEFVDRWLKKYGEDARHQTQATELLEERDV